MITVEQIEREIELLSQSDYSRLTVWWDKRRNDEWDRQMERDSASGKLDFLFEEAESESKAGKLQDWPPVS